MCVTSMASAQWVTTQLTNNSISLLSLQINDSGHVVWCDYDYDDFDYEIFYYDGNTVTQLTDNDVDDLHPRINANGHIVWWDYIPNPYISGDYIGHIFYYNFAGSPDSGPVLPGRGQFSPDVFECIHRP